jgi:tetratricopeptide (TPR) repeat protein
MSETPTYVHRINAALALLEITEYWEAFEQLQAAEKLAPDNPYIHFLKGLSWLDVILEGREDDEIVDIEEALGHFKEALRLDPDYHEAREALGIALIEQEEYEEGVETLEPLVQADPSDVSLCRTFARGLKNIKRIDEALEVLRQCSELNPDDEYLSIHLADYLSEYDKKNEAINVLRKAVDHKPSALLFSEIGKVYAKFKDYENAIPELEHAIKLAPKKEHNWEILAKCLLKTNKLQAAMEFTEEGINKFPNSSNLPLTKAEIFWENDLEEESFTYIEKLIEIFKSKDDGRGHFQLLYNWYSRFESKYGPDRVINEIDDLINQKYEELVINVSEFFFLPIKVEEFIKLGKFSEAKLNLDNFSPIFTFSNNYIKLYYQTLLGLGKPEEAESFLDGKLSEINDIDKQNALRDEILNF